MPQTRPIVDRKSDFPPWAPPFDPSDTRSIGTIAAESSSVSSLPQRIAWATVDWAGNVASGSIWIAPHGPERDQSHYKYPPDITREQLQDLGLPLCEAARMLNEALGCSRVEMRYRQSQCPIMALYKAACAWPTWTPEFSMFGPLFSELTLWINERVHFGAHHPSLEFGVEIEERVRRFVEDYHAARGAYLTFSRMLAG